MAANPETTLEIGAFVLGAVFGAVAQCSKFCMVAALSNWVIMRDYRQIHAALAAMAVAMVGTQWLEAQGWVAVAESSYRSANVDWLGAMGGGLLFGLGAALAGGCAARTMVRAAEGNLGSLLALLTFGGASMVALFGILEPARRCLGRATSIHLTGGDASIAALGHFSPWWVVGGFALLAAGVILLTGRRTRSAGMILAGILIGVLVTAGWWLTGYFARDEFSASPPLSLTFSGPLARFTLYVTTDLTTTNDFGIFLVAGALVGALTMALTTRTFHIVAPASSRVGAYMLGGAFMGIGAIFAGGCNIGQGLSGLATLSIQSMAAVAAIGLGMRLGIAWLDSRS